MDYFKDYLNSFKLKSMFLYTLVVDALTWLLIGVMFYWVGNNVRSRLQLLTGGMAADVFQQYFLSLSPEQIPIFSAQLKTAMIQLAGFIFVLPIVALLLYSLSRAILWNMLLNREFHFKQHWKWNLLNIVLLFIAAVLFIAFVFLQLLAARVPVLSSLLGFLLVVGFVALMFVAYRHFAHTRKVFESIGMAFKAFKRKDFYVVLLFGAVTLFLMRFVQYPFREQLFIYPNAGLYVSLLIFLLWLSWFRMYVVARV